jgi:hypothetical protein
VISERKGIKNRFLRYKTPVGAELPVRPHRRPIATLKKLNGLGGAARGDYRR